MQMKRRYATLSALGLLMLGLLIVSVFCANPESTDTPVTLDISHRINENGLVQESVQYSTKDGMLAIDVYSGTTARTKYGEPLQYIVVKEAVPD